MSVMFSIERTGDHAVVSLTGDVDLAVRRKILDSYDHAITLMIVPHLVADVSGVTFMDATGLGTIAAARNQAKARGGSVSVVGASDRIMRLFHIGRLDDVITMLAQDQPPLPEAVPRTRQVVG